MAENLGNTAEQIEVITEGMTEDVTDKKCPNCGATVVYDPETLAMSCPFCGYSRQLPKPEDNGQDVEELDFSSAKNRESLDWGKAKKSLVCKNCGAETIMDEADTAQCCPYCGSTQVMPVDNDEDVVAPGGVVPFEITKEKAAQLFKGWMKGKLFAPNEAKKSCEAKNFSGIYLPYWTYDSQTTSPYEIRLGFDKKDKDGNVTTTYRTYRGIYERFIDDETVYASKKTTNRFIKEASKFDFSKLRKYSPEFIAGFLAERYTVGLDEGWETAKDQIRKKLKSEIGQMEKKKRRADSISKVDFATSYANVTFKYVLAPIWIANFKFKDKVYNLVVNGQTGKISGKSPISPIKVAIAIIIAIIVLVVLFNLMGN
jgi:DNA-directed RNA polymerase subunit RPC12/RpoP